MFVGEIEKKNKKKILLLANSLPTDYWKISEETKIKTFLWDLTYGMCVGCYTSGVSNYIADLFSSLSQVDTS